MFSLESSVHFVVLDILRYLCCLDSDFLVSLASRQNLISLLEQFSNDPKSSKMKIRMVVNLFAWPLGQAAIANEFDNYWKQVKKCYQWAPELCKDELSAFKNKYDIMY